MTMTNDINTTGTKQVWRQFKTGEAADFLNVSRTTIYRMTKALEIPFITYGKRKKRYPEDKLIAWKEKLTINPKV